MAKIYLAGKWEEADRIAHMAKHLIACGHTITEPWFLHNVDFCSHDDIPDLQSQAIADVRGLEECDTFVGIFENNLPYSGAIAEFGMAVVLKKRIFILGHQIDHNVFMNLEGIKTFTRFTDLAREL